MSDSRHSRQKGQVARDKSCQALGKNGNKQQPTTIYSQDSPEWEFHTNQ